MKSLLVERGMPQEEIAFVHSYTSEATRVALYEKVNRGIVRVLIGSTFKLGIGANVQTKLKAVHHLDAPWRPADMVQREGRIMRKGNLNEEIRIFAISQRAASIHIRGRFWRRSRDLSRSS